MLKCLLAQASGRLEFNRDTDVEVSPSDARQQEWSFCPFYDICSEGRMKLVGDRLDVFLCLFHTVRQGHEHAPAMRILHARVRVGRLGVYNIFVRVTERELDQALVLHPFSGLLEF